MGSPEQQRVWTTLHFLELKVPQQLWHLSRVSTGGNLNSAQVIKTLFAPQRLALCFRNNCQLVKNYQLLSPLLTCLSDWELLPYILCKSTTSLFTDTAMITVKREYHKRQLYQAFVQVLFSNIRPWKTILSNVDTVALYLQKRLIWLVLEGGKELVCIFLGKT